MEPLQIEPGSSFREVKEDGIYWVISGVRCHCVVLLTVSHTLCALVFVFVGVGIGYTWNSCTTHSKDLHKDSAFSGELPGTLEPNGEFYFDKIDLQHKPTRDERERDFTRICNTKGDFYSIDAQHPTHTLKAVELETGHDAATWEETWGEVREVMQKSFNSKSMMEKFFKSGMYAFISASSPFDFVTKFKAVPQFDDTFFVVIFNLKNIGSFRAFWCGLMNTEAIAMGANDIWPFTVAFLSDDVQADTEINSDVKFEYFCRPNSEKSVMGNCEKILREHALLN